MNYELIHDFSEESTQRKKICFATDWKQRFQIPKWPIIVTLKEFRRLRRSSTHLFSERWSRTHLFPSFKQSAECSCKEEILKTLICCQSFVNYLSEWIRGPDTASDSHGRTAATSPYAGHFTSHVCTLLLHDCRCASLKINCDEAEQCKVSKRRTQYVLQ